MKWLALGLGVSTALLILALYLNPKSFSLKSLAPQLLATQRGPGGGNVWLTETPLTPHSHSARYFQSPSHQMFFLVPLRGTRKFRLKLESRICASGRPPTRHLGKPLFRADTGISRVIGTVTFLSAFVRDAVPAARLFRGMLYTEARFRTRSPPPLSLLAQGLPAH